MKDERDDFATRAFLEPEEKQLGKLTLRPVTLASLTLLRVTGNEFLAPRGVVTVDFQTGKQEPAVENELFAALAFAYIHGAPIAEVRRVVWVEAVFREKVLEWGENITAETLPQLMGEIERSLSAINALQVATKEKPKTADSDEPTPPPN